MKTVENQASQILEVFGRAPLLQAGELHKANQIGKPEQIPAPSLELWHTVARGICNTQGFQAVAFTEFPPDLQRVLGFSDGLPPHVIYYRSAMSENGVLLINTSIRKADARLITRLEGCGSIEHGKTWFFRLRPIRTELNAWLYEPGRNLSKQIIQEFNPHTALGAHELEHLRGETAIDHPNEIIDIRDPDDWTDILATFTNYTEDTICATIHRLSPDGLLVFDHQSNQFIILDEFGRYLRPLGP